MKAPEDIMEELKEVVKQTAFFIENAAASFDPDDIEKKGFNDLVSYVDKQAEEKLVKGCRNILPEAGFITEEGTAEREKKSYTWIIDPLDGTTNFVHGLPVFAISIALLRDDDLCLGIVHEINRNEMFTAIQGQGAFCNDRPVHVTKKAVISEALLATGFPYYDFGKMEKYLGILDEFMQHTHGLRRLGSAAVDLAYVACGRFEGFFEYNLNSWDVAAGALIVKEAGGMVSDFSGGEDFLFGRELIAASPGIHPEMLRIIRSRWTDAN